MAARFTHLALPCRDLDATIAWYETHTPMRAFHRRVDADAEVAWLAEVLSGGGTTVGLVVVQTFEAKASGEPRAICIAEPKRSHGPLVACALSAIPTECGGVQARSETKRPSAVDTGRSIGANGCQVTNWLGCGVGAVDTFVAPDHLCRLHSLLHSVGGQHPEDHWHTG